ncbi:hypothetical protein FRC14_004007 [Serendipita sp. 396]|nr:hypothetical protein FRC14_004007 [Serendipita sp. 396]
MRIFIFHGITVELPAQDDHFLQDIYHLVLELKLSDGSVDSADLLSRGSDTGIWDANDFLVLPEIGTHITLSVFADLGGDERQLVASKELYGPELCNESGEPVEILLNGHDYYVDMILKTKVVAVNPFTQNFGENMNDVNRIITQQHEEASVITDDHPDKPSRLNKLGVSLFTRFRRFGNLDDINNAVARLQEAINLTPDSHPDKPGLLSNLGTSLLARAKRLGNLNDTASAITHLQAAVNLTPDGHPDKPFRLNNLGLALHNRFDHLGDLDDIDSAIAQLQAADSLTPDGHPDKAIRSRNLGTFLVTRFERLGDLEDIDHAIARLQAADKLTPDGHPDRPSQLSNLGSALRTRFERFGNLDDIENSITQLHAAVDLTPDDHPHKPIRFNNLGISLLNRFKCLGNLDDISNAILRLQAAVDLAPNDHPEKPKWLSNLGSSLISRFKRIGDTSDLDDAIARLQVAVNLTPDGHPEKLYALKNLGNSLLTRFRRFGNLQDINNAVAKLQEAENLTPHGHPDNPNQLNNLGIALVTRFEHIGNLDDMENAVARLQEAVNHSPEDHPDKANRLSNLGTSLLARFEHLGNLSDIDDAIVQLQVAVNLALDDHPDKPAWLSNLGLSLQARFSRLGNPDDIDNSVARLQTAVNLTPDGHPEKPRWLNNLGISLFTRFERLGNLDDIETAVLQLHAAVDLTPDGHPDKRKWLTHLGTSLVTRFERLGDTDDIDNGISRLQAAVNLTPDGHPLKPGLLSNLGTSLLTRFQRLNHLHDAEACIDHFSAAALSPVGSPSIRLGAARKWILAALTTTHTSLLAACECAISIIPLVAWLGLSIPDRHQHLVEIGGIVRDAAAIAILVDEFDRALEWLEQGRSIVWNQILQLRTPVDELRAVEPDLADRLLHVSSLLYQGSQDTGHQSEPKRSPEEEVRQYRALAKERDDIVEKVRSLPKFHNFLKPLRIQNLLEATKEGPVIIVNVSLVRCDALVLVDGVDEAIHIPLPDLTPERVNQLQIKFNGLLKSSGVRQRAVRDEDVDIGGDEECKKILAELWDHLVKPVLDSLAFSSDPDTLPRMWWCVTGPLAFLPIHAAGVYDTADPTRRIQNYAIVSYAPTISSLLEQSGAPIHKPFRHLSAIEPSSGLSYIPNTEKELDYIQHRLQNRDHVVLYKADATKDRVMKEMRDCNWLHLACHETQNATNPIKSALLLHGGKLTLEEIIRLDLPHAEFAFLSACQTMTGDENLSDEAVHIAGGMLLAGYRSVVATMWSIEDALAPKVADEFYARLLRDGERPDNRKAAEALYFSVKKLQEEEKDIRMLSWLPFVHLGI